MKKIIIALLIGIIANQIIAQDYKFGKVSVNELQEKFHPQDSSANAAYLYKDRKIYYTYDGETGWAIVTEVHERIKLYNKEGFDYATEKIRLYDSSSSEKVSSIKGYTYNLENGSVVKEKLDKKQVFKERKSKNIAVQKFTMPNLKQGSIVEWQYKITSPFALYIDEISLQHTIPIKHINITVQIPEYFNFKRHLKGYLPINVVENMRNRTIQYSYRSKSSSKRITTERSAEKVSLQEKVYTINKSSVPALKEESHVSNINNYRSTLPLELSYTRFPGSPAKSYSTTWEDVCDKIYKANDFGEELKKINYFKNDLSLILENTNREEQLGVILQFVKSKVKWNGEYGKYTDEGVKKAYKEGVGNVAEINLMLISMLNEAGFKANPVLVSTRNNGIPVYPTSKGFNYVIAAAEMNGELFLLDATEEFSIPNVLPVRDINWRGRIIKDDKTSDWISLVPTVPSVENVAMNININSDGFIEGMQRVNYTNILALDYRNKYSKLTEETIIEKVEEKNGAIEISSFRMLNKDKINKPIVEMFQFSSEDLVDVVGDKIYFKPLLYRATIENPFKLEKREYPIDFGAPFKEKNLISYTIPEGYTIEFIPENIAVGLSDNYGVYKFSVKVEGNKINVMSILEINTAVFPALNYAELKEFYRVIVNKNLERIVLQKG